MTQHVRELHGARIEAVNMREQRHPLPQIPLHGRAVIDVHEFARNHPSRYAVLRLRNSKCSRSRDRAGPLLCARDQARETGLPQMPGGQSCHGCGRGPQDRGKGQALRRCGSSMCSSRNIILSERGSKCRYILNPTLSGPLDMSSFGPSRVGLLKFLFRCSAIGFEWPATI